MSTTPDASHDDDALSWDGDESLNPGPSTLPRGWKAVGKGSASMASPTADAPAAAAVAVSAPEQTHGSGNNSNATLIALGVFGGVYLLFTIGWIVSGMNLEILGERLIANPLSYAIGTWMAAAAPAMWFAMSLYLTRASKTWVRFAWLIAGAVVLIPWPFVMTGVAS